MDYPNPTDLFATKGIEYLLVLGFLVAFVLFWRLIARRGSPSGTPVAAGPSATTPSGWFNFPLERFYHWGHGWARPEADGSVTVGLDDFARKLVGPPERVALPACGTTLSQGGRMSRLSIGDKGVDLVAPVAGEVVECNQAVLDHPELLGDDPYGDGWLLRVRPQRLESSFDELLQGNAAKSWIDSMEDGLRRRMSPSFGLLMQDGGVPVSGIARVLAGDDWDEFARELLRS